MATKNEPFLANAKGELLEQYSSVTKLYRVTAWVRRFMDNCKNKIAQQTEKYVGPLSAEEILDAEHLWLTRVQRTHFSEELDCLADPKNPKPLPKGFKLIGLRP